MNNANTKKLLFLFTFLFPSIGFSQQPEIKVLHGHIINIHYNNQYKEAYRAKLLYGYGLLDDERLFVASQKQGSAEAIAELKVINFKTNKTTNITNLGCAGESNFDVNKKNHKIIFNVCGGINLLTINKDNTFKIKLIHNDSKDNIWAVFWSGEAEIGYINYSGDQPSFITKKVKF